MSPASCILANRLVLFDHDDTIVAAKDHRHDALRRTLRSLGGELSAEALESTYGRSFREIAKAIAPAIPFNTFLEAYAADVNASPAPLLPGVRDLLDAIQTVGASAAIVSSSHSRLIRAELLAHGLSSAFALIYGTDHEGPIKPDPASLLAAADALGPPSDERPVYIGDSLTDWKMAECAGLHFVGVTTGTATARDFHLAGVPSGFVVATLSAVSFGSR